MHDTIGTSPLSGKTVVITGANAGLGAEVARQAARGGARVVMACRNIGTAQTVADQIGGNTLIEQIDLSDLESVRSFAKRFDEPVDVLINNAGIMNVPRGATSDGFENTFGTNHLGHFALTGLLLDRIRERVVTVSSVAHFGATNRSLADPLFRHRRYRRNVAYSNSKIANLIFARELARRLAAHNSPVVSAAAHPGVVATGLYDHSAVPLLDRAKPLVTALGGTLSEGTAPILRAAFAPAVAGGDYYGPRYGFRGNKAVRSPSSPLSRSIIHGQWLWELSERLTGVRYGLAAT